MEPFADESAVLRGELSKTAFIIPDGLAFDEWAQMGHPLIVMAQASMWWIGDWLHYGERNYGETYSQAVEATGYKVKTLQNAMWVADRFPPEERREELSFSHHRAVASLESSPRGELLQRAVDEHMSEGELIGRVKAIKAAEKEPERPKASKVEVIDPEPPKTRTEAIERAISVLEQATVREDWSLVKQAIEILWLCGELA